MSEIKVDGKPFLIELMKKIVGDLKSPHVFFNDEYVGVCFYFRSASELTLNLSAFSKTTSQKWKINLMEYSGK